MEGKSVKFNLERKGDRLVSSGDCWVAVAATRMAGEGKRRMLIVFSTYVDLTFPCYMQNNRVSVVPFVCVGFRYQIKRKFVKLLQPQSAISSMRFLSCLPPWVQ